MHGLLGVPGANNNLNVLSSSPPNGLAFKVSWPHVPLFFSAQCPFDLLYLLFGFKYPPYCLLFSAISYHSREIPADCAFSNIKEAVRNCIERSFCVLKARFTWTKTSFRLLHQVYILYSMKSCLILHIITIS